MLNFFVFFLSLAFAVGADRLTKWLATDYFELPFRMGNAFSLDVIQTQSYIFSPVPDGLVYLFIAALVILLLIWLGYRFGVWEEWAGNMGYGFMFGAMGSNLFDRIYNGYILDWFTWKGVAFLNAADLFVVVGLIILAIMIWRRR